MSVTCPFLLFLSFSVLPTLQCFAFSNTVKTAGVDDVTDEVIAKRIDRLIGKRLDAIVNIVVDRVADIVQTRIDSVVEENVLKQLSVTFLNLVNAFITLF